MGHKQAPGNGNKITRKYSVALKTCTSAASFNLTCIVSNRWCGLSARISRKYSKLFFIFLFFNLNFLPGNKYCIQIKLIHVNLFVLTDDRLITLSQPFHNLEQTVHILSRFIMQWKVSKNLDPLMPQKCRLSYVSKCMFWEFLL